MTADGGYDTQERHDEIAACRRLSPRNAPSAPIFVSLCDAVGEVPDLAVLVRFLQEAVNVSLEARALA